MDTGGLEKLIVAAGAAIASALTPIGVIYTASLNKKNALATTQVSDLLKEVERLKKELDESQTATEEERASGLRWYELTVFWFHLAHEMRLRALEAQQVAEATASRGNLPEPKWSHPLTLPRMEEPVKRPA